MAIITNIIDERDHCYAQQYVNVHRLIAKKESMDVEIGIHQSEQSSRNGVPPHRIETIYDAPLDLTGELNAWQQAYARIKERFPEFVDA